MNSTALYGIAAFADGYAVFWNGRYDETRYATREAAISELAKRDRAEQPRQPTPCQQQQANAGGFNPRHNSRHDRSRCEGSGWLRNLFGARVEHCPSCKAEWRGARRAALAKVQQ